MTRKNAGMRGQQTAAALRNGLFSGLSPEEQSLVANKWGVIEPNSGRAQLAALVIRSQTRADSTNTRDAGEAAQAA